MDDDANAQAPRLLWINWTTKVVSFHRVEGFEPMAFPNRNSMMAYVIQKVSSGFRIQ